jgi:hypothetical protein
MPGLADQDLADVIQRTGVVVLQVIQRGAPVPCLDIIGAQLDDGIQELQRYIDLLGVHRRLGARHQERRGVARGFHPQRPDPRLDMLGAGLVRRGLERAEQEIQPAGAVGADLRKLARRFRQLLLGFRWGNDPGVVLGERPNGHGRRDGGENHDSTGTGDRESQKHGPSLDVQNRAAKQHFVKDL